MLHNTEHSCEIDYPYTYVVDISMESTVYEVSSTAMFRYILRLYSNGDSSKRGQDIPSMDTKKLIIVI